MLLGLIVEKVFEMPFSKALETHIFEPLEMNDSGLSFYSDKFDQSKLAPLFIKGVDVRVFKSLSCDFSGSGIFTTTEDLLKFIKSFYKGEIISKNSIETMANFENRFHIGLHYGLGMMEARFKEKYHSRNPNRTIIWSEDVHGKISSTVFGRICGGFLQQIRLRFFRAREKQK